MFSYEDQQKLLRFQKAQITYDYCKDQSDSGPIWREQLSALEGLKSITDPEVARLVKVATQPSLIDDLSLEDMKLKFAEIQKALQELVKISIGVKDIRPDFLRRPN